ncbi:hypothetical protein jhhlp_006131 [Lomentospora prolificans]|uniref:SWR1-complex protein 4 n=1 Tax=Lomentospora prolificans TaxID=41688 RepID=A0A2N3N523_9PEZI|nr:hypothetical protein jhhlp_006131 [Lomentospora prolificans]
MSSSDVRDVLNLPTDGAARPSKKIKSSGPRPNLKGLAREVQSLGGDNPIVIAPEITFKKRRHINKKPAAAWELKPFRNSARDDSSLVLRHWRRKTESARAPNATGENGTTNGGDKKPEQECEDSAFAKYNVKVTVPQYSDDQYRLNLHNPDWTKDETDYLLALAKEYDLRWPVIWDRYEFVPSALNGETGVDGDESKAIIPAPKDRTLEDLKARYYEVASKMMVLQKPEQYMTDAEKNLYAVMSKFDPVSEETRKKYAAAFLERSREEAKEEESLLVEVRRIMARNERFNEERRELYRRLDYPHTDQDISSFKSSAGLQSLLQNLLAVDKSKKRKSIAPAEGTSPSTAAQATPAAETAQNRRDSIAASSAQGHNRRESGSVGPTQTPTAAPAKKGTAPQEKKKLSQQEQVLYGVSNHDRLSSGPTFRTERINRLFSQRSGQMQLRITNVLTELDFPAKLTMPTYNVTSQYERLLSSIINLLDVRKQSDKLDSELKVEMQKKALREAENKPAEEADGDKSKEDGKVATQDPPVAAEEPSKKAGEATQTEKADEEATEEAPDADGVAGSSDDKKDAAAPASEPAAPDVPKEEAGAASGEQDKEKLTRPGSSGHKRSASVLSTTSDKSSKRQKK